MHATNFVIHKYGNTQASFYSYGVRDNPEELYARISELINHLPFIIGIDGRSGAGKTRTARALAQWLKDSRIIAGRKVSLRVVVVELEMFIEGWNGLVEGTHHVARTILEPFHSHGRAQATPWNWESDSWEDTPTDIAGDVLILVGCGSTSVACAPYLDLTMWVDAPENLRRERVEYREAALDSGDLVPQWWDDWAAQEESLLASHNSPEHADITIKNDIFRPEKHDFSSK